MQYFNVYINGTNSLYTYADKDDEFKIGENVIVPFRNVKKTGIIIEKSKETEFEFKVLNIASKIKKSFVLSECQLDLIRWLVDYYMSSYEQVIRAVIPKKVKIDSQYFYFLNFEAEKLKDNLENKVVRFFLENLIISYGTAKTKFKKSITDSLISKEYLSLKEDKVILDILKFSELKGINSEVYNYFLKKIFLKKEKLEKEFSLNSLRDLKNIDILKIETELKEETRLEKDDLEKVKKNKSTLNKEQNKVLEEIKKGKDSYYLLKGVTGSGKTEIYIELIKDAFFKGKGSIFLVPEISLTPQMIGRFKTEFKNNIAILHSRLSDKERAKEWESLYKGEKKIVLGVRSAIFSPVRNLEYIILDEEHETTYKQDSNPRYSAKYVAIKRCLLENSKLILGSATPSIESYYYAKQGIYKLLELNKRYGDAKIPDVEIVDMKQEEDLFFSKKLLREIKETLLRDEQVILLLNRKGYSTYIQCKDCGYVEECEDCSIKMSYYSSSKIYKCNYCGKIRKYNGKCKECGSTNLIHSGKGIERVEEELKKYFDVPIIKADSDSSRDKEFFKNLYEDFLKNKYKILIGTQIVAKGLHFPNVTLVGVINSDIILNFPDFRAGEKTFQLLTQVSGRAGRGDKNGKVIIQTYHPENDIIKNSKEENYEEFYNKEISSRRIFFYPPFLKTINIGISSENEMKLIKESKKLLKTIKTDKLEIYGPMPSLVYKVKKRYRMNIFIKGNKNTVAIFKKILEKKLNDFKDSEIRITVDIDPLNLI